MTSSTFNAFDAPRHNVGRLCDHQANLRAALIDRRILAVLAAVAEGALLAASGWIGATLHVENGLVPLPSAYLLAILPVTAVAIASFAGSGLYALNALREPLRHVPHLLGLWTAAIAMLALALFLAKSGAAFSRVWLVLWLIIGSLALAALRPVWSRMIRSWSRAGRLNERAVIYGVGDTTHRLIADLEANPDQNLRIIGIFDDRITTRSDTGPIAGYPQIGTLDELIATVRATRIDTIIVTLPVTAETRLSSIFDRLFMLPADIRIPAAASRLRFSPSAYTRVGGVPMLAVHDKPISGWGMLAKTVFDRIVAGLALIVLAPVLAAVAIAVKLESTGPVLFRQKRHGFNNELIEIFKFRSMHTETLDADAARLVTRGDPRVTRVGRFIRRTSLDELPQLINVLRGDLSLVGPRPHALQAKAANRLYADVADRYFARHKVKPGITGWAQINGWRGETDTEEKLKKRVEYDLYYIENWSLLFDLLILLRTPVSLLKAENAY